ncbi:carboxypeptidase regulatory-like domain-containing protein [Sphingomonas arantia]|uniref:Carboxypeptidase regulatory-like domain-containing protein n=1 Tax=Sphingomonas arantia TaxID=1460676 RepID=A0ABW4U0W0_9SPHN
MTSNLRLLGATFLVRSTSIRALTAFAVLATMIPSVAAAQDFQNVTASGRIVTTAGAGVAGATVAFQSAAQGFTRTTTTDGGGNYRLPQLPLGTYTVTITATGFATSTQSGVVLEPDQASNQFSLAAVGETGAAGNAAGTAAGGDAIVVTGTRTRTIDFERTTTGTVVNVTEIARQVPVDRSLTAIIRLSPGTSQGDSAFGDLASFSGASVSENQFFVNGLNVTNFRKGLGSTTVPFEFYDTVDIKNGGYPAEFGRATGGFVSATTKSGSNEFHAGAVLSYTPDFLRSDSPNTFRDDNDGDIRESRNAYFYASGPLIKDRLFFYGFYQARHTQQGDGSVTDQRYSERVGDSPYWGGKLDAIIADGHRLEFTYFDTSRTETITNLDYDVTTNQRTLFQSSDVEKFGGKNFVGRYTGTFTEWLTLSAAYGKNKDREVTQSSSDNPYILDQRTGTALSIGNPTATRTSSFDTREFYRADADIYFNLLGSHHIRGGYDRENLTSDTTSSYNGGVAYTYLTAAAGNRYAPAGTEYVSARTYFNGGVFKTRNEAFYIQDTWSLFNNRLNLSLGVRNDRFTNQNVDGETYYESGDQWGPRLGFTFDPTGDARTKIYGSFGRIFQPVATNTNIRLAGAETDYTRYYQLFGVNADNSPILGQALSFTGGSSACPGSTDANCQLVSDGTATPTEATVSKSLKPQSIDEYIIGGERRLGSRIRVGLYGTYRKLNASLEDAAIDQGVLAYCNREGISGCEDIWTGFHQYVLINPGEAATITLSDPINGEATARTVSFTAEELGYPKARRTYKAITATFNREFDGLWTLNGSYTYAKNRGNIEGGVKSDNGQSDSGLTTDFDQPGFTQGAYGYLPGDRRHNIKLYGAYQVRPWLLIGANFAAVSPRRFGCIGLVPDSVDPFANAYGSAGNFCPIVDGQVSDDNETVLVQRGSVFKSDWNTSTDLTLSFRPQPENRNLTFEVSVFNVFNQKAKIDYDEQGTDDGGAASATYRLPTSYQSPRSARFVARIGF